MMPGEIGKLLMCVSMLLYILRMHISFHIYIFLWIDELRACRIKNPFNSMYLLNAHEIFWTCIQK